MKVLLVMPKLQNFTNAANESICLTTRQEKRRLGNEFNCLFYCLTNQPMEPTKVIETVVIQLKKYVLFLWPYLLGGIGFILFAEIGLRSTVLTIMGIAVFILAPLILNRQFRSGFTKKARLQFFPDHLVIELINKDTDVVERTDDFQFNQIASFRTGDSSRDDSSFISLLLTDGRKFNYSFLEQRRGNPDDDVTPNVEKYIRAYNESHDFDRTIRYQPSMMASRTGKYMFIGLTILLAAAIIIQLIVKPKSIPISLGLGLILYLMIWLQRKYDLDRAKAVNGPDSPPGAPRP
jgi:hypothetical protein